MESWTDRRTALSAFADDVDRCKILLDALAEDVDACRAVFEAVAVDEDAFESLFRALAKNPEAWHAVHESLCFESLHLDLEEWNRSAPPEPQELAG